MKILTPTAHRLPPFFATFCLIALLSGLTSCDRQQPAESPTVEPPPVTSSADATGQPLSVFELSLGALIPDLASPDQMTLRGELQLSDTVDVQQLAPVLKAQVGDAALPVHWEAAPAGSNTYVFQVGPIEREDTARTLVLSWDGSSLGFLARKGKRSLTVPAENVFLVTGARVVQKPERYVEVTFSQPLDAAQNLAGLVELKGTRARPQIDGSRLRLYFDTVPEAPVELRISQALRSSQRQPMTDDYRRSLTLALATPGVRFLDASSILPPAAQISVPFEAVGVDSVQITAFKVFAPNLGQYFQNKGLATSYPDSSTGRYLWRKNYRLPAVAPNKWKQYSLDLTELMAQHPEGLLRLEISIDRSNSVYLCDEARPGAPEKPAPVSHEGDWSYQNDEQPNWYRRYYQSQGYLEYSERHNPCHASYFEYSRQTKTARNLMVSNLGIIAKRGDDDKLEVIVTDLLNTEPLDRVQVRAFNFQQQNIGAGMTDAHGMVTLRTDGVPFYLTAGYGGRTGYLRLARNEALPVNLFDVGGEPTHQGLKGFIYGERDIWRPGDDIHLAFILEDREARWPDDHPVTLDLFDPRGNKVYSAVNTTPVGDFYVFTASTDETAPTGNWRAVVHLGSQYWDKTLKIESIMPNRLKLDLSLPETLFLEQMPVKAVLSAQWLHGATAANLRADSEIRLSTRTSRFDGYSQFTFDDPARRFASSHQPAFAGQLDSQGSAAFTARIQVATPPPGMLTATFVNRVFEPGGAFSTQYQQAPLLPFDHWVGVQIPKADGLYDSVPRDRDHPVYFQTINADGTPLQNRKLEVTLFHIDWRWWWDRGSEDLASFMTAQSHQPLERVELTTDDRGRAQWGFIADKYDWGRYLLRACDADGSHCAGEVVYLGWSPHSAVNPSAATQLMLSTDQPRYTVGQVARVLLPELEEGRVLLSLENGSQVIQRNWLDLEPGQREFEIPITADMAPNIYVHLSILLPHQQRTADAPMRLYGLVPLVVEDPETRLQPRIDAPTQTRPESTFRVKVSETRGRAMSYTLALVDEGLLGLTGYKAPDPHQHFYKREALGVHTWDLFDQVVGAYGASLQNVLKVGGSDADAQAQLDAHRRRFPPVVRFLGAFTLEKGAQREHEFTLPPYLGAVRVMAVAGHNGAYGRAEASVTVTQPLSVLATLPRIVRPGEEITLPVQVFANSPTLTEAQISATTDALFTVVEGARQLTLTGGEGVASLRLKVNDQIGRGQVTVTASSGDETATHTIWIESLAANPATVKSAGAVLQPGETWQALLQPHGIAGTNSTSLEVGRLPPLNLEQRLEYLLSYPHGCLEQVVSTAFPQLYLNRLIPMSAGQTERGEANIKAAVERLRNFQLSSGEFSYWPGTSYSNAWASIYTGHFLIEAQRAGYPVPQDLLDRWFARQTREADNYSLGAHDWEVDVAAYRLYALTLAGRPNTPAMNRLREQLLQRAKARPAASSTARHLLAASYHRLDLADAARDLDDSTQVQPAYPAPGYTYGSALRDRAIELLLAVEAEQTERTWSLAEDVAERLSAPDWYSTQTTAWALSSLALMAGESASRTPLDFAIADAPGASWQTLRSQHPWYRQDLDHTGVTVRNDSQEALRVLVSNRGIPAMETEEAVSEGLHLDVAFTTLTGEPLKVDQLPQGTDFMARVKVTADFNRLGRRHLENIALSLPLPSGWQVRNERLEGAAMPEGIDHWDIRDDQVLAYFSLWRDYKWHYRYTKSNQDSVTVQLLLNASYAGRFYLPGWQAEAMYDGRVRGSTAGFWVEVTR